MLKLRKLAARLEDSLLAIPGVFILAGAVLAVVTARIDRDLTTAAPPIFPEATVAGTRVILGTLAGATITVAALAFSIMALTVQMSASQYSPRVLHGLLRDRYQQTIVGIIVGTFTYSLVALGAIGPVLGADSERQTASWSALTGTALGIATALAIVAFVDHISRRVRVDDTIRRLTAETISSLEATARRRPRGEPDDRFAIAPERDKSVIRSDRSGWLIGIDPAVLAQQLDDGAIARVEVPVGAYVNPEDPLVTVWTAAAPGGSAAANGAGIDVGAALPISSTRTIGQDPLFGIRQLVDIALRALSPGINDPTTAADVTRHLVGPVQIALRQSDASLVFHGERGVKVYQPAARSAADYVRLAFAEIRLAAGPHPGVYSALWSALQSLRSYVGETTDARAAIDTQLDMVGAAARDAGFSEADLRAIEGWTATPRLGDLDP